MFIHVTFFAVHIPPPPLITLTHAHFVAANELWVMALEKAYAKMSGAYGNLVGGLVHVALVDMTGGFGEEMYAGVLRLRVAPVYFIRQFDFCLCLSVVHGASACFVVTSACINASIVLLCSCVAYVLYFLPFLVFALPLYNSRLDEKVKRNTQGLWERLEQYREAGYLMGAGSNPGSDAAPDEKGIVPVRHAKFIGYLNGSVCLWVQRRFVTIFLLSYVSRFRDTPIRFLTFARLTMCNC